MLEGNKEGLTVNHSETEGLNWHEPFWVLVDLLSTICTLERKFLSKWNTLEKGRFFGKNT